MKFISPIKRHSGFRVMVSQQFGANPEKYSQFKDDYGNPLKGHNGVDFTLGYDARKMYGSNINTICNGRVSILIWDNPMSTKGNGVYVDSDIETGSDGKQRFYRVVYWHAMDIDVRVGQSVKMGDYICDMGNSGWVFPQPTITNPYGGTHLHLGFYPYIYDNNVWKKEFPNNGFDGAVDPLPFIGNINPDNWETKEDIESIWEKLFPVKWAIEKIKESLGLSKVANPL